MKSWRDMGPRKGERYVMLSLTFCSAWKLFLRNPVSGSIRWHSYPRRSGNIQALVNKKNAECRGELMKGRKSNKCHFMLYYVIEFHQTFIQCASRCFALFYILLHCWIVLSSYRYRRLMNLAHPDPHRHKHRNTHTHTNTHTYKHSHIQTYTHTNIHTDTNTIQMTVTHHITSHHITSHHITSHHITSHHITSNHITSSRVTYCLFARVS